jgi:NADH-quinone oxidoreductase subunit L
MEGPTPISALIHAATMVTAGIFMVARMSPLFELSDTALSFVLIIGATTAFFMGLLGIVNNDIKRVIAYSTLVAARLHDGGARRHPPTAPAFFT